MNRSALPASLLPLLLALATLPTAPAQPLAPDADFGEDGRVLANVAGPTSEAVRAIAVDDSDRIVSLASGFDQRALVRQLADGSLDQGFGEGGIVVLDFAPADLALQADGRIVVAGTRDVGPQDRDFVVARFEADGDVDTGFGDDGQRQSDFFQGTDEARALALDGDGSIVLAGLAFEAGVGTRVALARYDASGVELALRADKLATGTADIFEDVLIQPDGRVVGIGLVRNFSDADAVAVRYEGDFSMDTGFGTDGVAQVDFGQGPNEALAGLLTPSGIVLGGFTEVGGGGYALALARLADDGALDAAFGSGGRVVTDVAGEDTEMVRGLLLDGSDIVVAAHTEDLDDFLLARYDASGAPLASFGTGGLVTTDFSGDVDLAAAIVLHQGRVLVGGTTVSDPRQLGNLGFARYLADGELDAAFGDAGTLELALTGPVASRGQALAVQADGKSILAGYVGGTFSSRDFAVVRHLPDGSIDAGFGDDGIVTVDFFGNEDTAWSVAVDAQSRILVAGAVREPPAGADFGVVRLLADGQLDPDFGDGGRVRVDFNGGIDGARQVLVQPDGAIVLVGEASSASFSVDFAAVRLLADGSLDAGFGDGGKALVPLGANSYDPVGGGALAGDGGVYIVGGDGDDLAVLKLDATGVPEATFGAGGKATVDFFGHYDFAHAALVADDGEGGERLLAVGFIREQSAASSSRAAVVAFDAGGLVDEGFGDSGSIVLDTGDRAAEATAATLGDGRVLLAGHVLDDQGTRDFLFAGLQADGQPDEGATPDGAWSRLDFRGGPDEAYAIAADANGGVLVGGWADNGDGRGSADQDHALARLAASPRVFADGFEASTP